MAGNNTVAFTPTGTGTVTAVTGTTTLTVGNLKGLTAGTLTAVVTSYTVKSMAVQVATVTPVVTSNAGTVAVNIPSLTISGFGYDPTFSASSYNTVAFTPTGTGTVNSVTVDSVAGTTSLNVTGITGLTVGDLNAVVTTNQQNSGTAVKVATVTPVVTSNAATVAANISTLTISGFGFDPVAGHNTVAFTPTGTGNVNSVAGTTSLNVTGITGLTAGDLNAVVTTNGHNSGAAVKVAAVTPVVTSSTDSLGYHAQTLTISGFGFDPTASKNAVVFTSGTGMVRSVNPTGTSMTVNISTVNNVGLAVGPLSAKVITNSQNSGFVQVATVTNSNSTPMFTSEGTAPGTTAGMPLTTTPGGPSATFDSVIWSPTYGGMVIASSGALAFRAHLDMVGGVTAYNYQGIWKSPDGTSGSTSLLARSGSAAPDTGTTNAVFDLLPNIACINNLGQTSFHGFLRVGTGVGPVTTTSNDSGIWTELGTGANGLRLLLRQGEAVTGGTVTAVAPSGWIGTSTPATTSGPGYATFNVQLDGGTAAPGSALLRATISTTAGVTTVAPATLAKQGDGAPGIGAATGGTFDVMYHDSNDPRMDDAGDVAFLANLVDGNSGIWYQTVAGALSAVARTGEATPGLADTFTGFERPSLAANGGHIAFRAFMTTIAQAVWAGDPASPGGLVAIAKTGDTALPGIPAGSHLKSVWSPFSNASGKVAFRVSLMDGSSVETGAIVTDTNGTLGVVAKVGDAAPGTTEVFLSFADPIIGDSNQVAFIATTATTLTSTTTHTGLWRQAPGGGALSLVLEVGDTFTINSATETVWQISIPGGSTNDRQYERKSMDQYGHIIMFVIYESGKTGIVLSDP